MELLRDEIAHMGFGRGIQDCNVAGSFGRLHYYKRGATLNRQTQSALMIPLILIMFLVLGGLAGCADTAMVDFYRVKSAEIDLKPKGVESLAVLNLEGPGDSGATMSELLTTKLVQGNYYKIFEREKLNKILNEQKLAMTGMIDEKTAAQVGKLAGVNAVLLGKVTAYSVKDEPYTKTVMESRATGMYRQECNKKGECSQVQVYEQVPIQQNHHRRNGTVSATQKVVHVETGRVVGARNATQHYKYDTGDPPKGTGLMGIFQPVPELGQEEVLTSLAEKVAEQLAGAIQAQKIQEKGEFELGGRSALLGEMGSDKEIRLGIEMTKAGRLDEAIQLYESMVSRDPQNCTAYYNMGIVQMEIGDHRKAEKALRAAEKCDPKPRYTAAVGECKKREKEQATVNPSNK
jgi:Curli production assembly/transport component CsgG/Tetratricopeptide repeat